MIDIMENKVFGPAILKAEATMLSRLLERRFGKLPEWVAERVETAKEDAILAWFDRAVSAPTVDEVFKE